MARQIETMNVDSDPQVDISSSIIDLPISKQKIGTSESSFHQRLSVLEPSALESPPSLTHTPTTSSSSSGSENSHPQEQLTGVKSLMEDEEDDDDNEPSIVDVTPSQRSDTYEDGNNGTGGEARLPDSPPYCRPTPVRAGSGGKGRKASSLFVAAEAADVEERDPPVERSSPGATSSEGNFFRPIGGEEYDPDHWHPVYSNSLCAHEVFFPSCDFHFSEQLDIMTNCRNPLSFWGDDQYPLSEEVVMDDDYPLHHGAYNVPSSCEYCGASHTSLCPDDCQRPKLFFRKMRPPFCPPGPAWDAKTDYPIPEEQPILVTSSSSSPRHLASSRSVEEQSQSSQERRPSLSAIWITDLFRSSISNNDTLKQRAYSTGSMLV